MVALPFGVAAYRRNKGTFSETRLINQYLEVGADNSVRLIGRPGLVPTLSVGDGPIVGIFAQPGTFNGDLFAVSGNILYREGTMAGVTPAASRVSMAGSELELLVATGEAMFRYDGTSVTLIAFPDNAGENSVVYFGSMFIVARTGTEKFYWSNVLDGSTWQSLNFASDERKPDNLVGLIVIGDELWMFGENSADFYQLSGDSTAPFQVIQGRTYDRGAINRDSIVAFDNTAAWVGQDRIVYRGAQIPLRISDFGIEERLGRTAATDIHAWSFIWNGHNFYVLNTIDGAFVYDAASKEWSEFKSYGRSGWRAYIGCNQSSTIYAGDDTDGTIWTFSDTQLFDDTDPIERVSSAILRHTGQPVSINDLIIDVSPGQTPYVTGQGADPQVEMRLSRDGGKTFSGWRAASLGQQGQYRATTDWRRMGMCDAPGMLFEFRTTDPAPWSLSGVRVNEKTGGRSR